MLAETQNYSSAHRTHFIFVGTHEQIVGSQYGGHGLSCLLEKCTKVVAHLWAHFASFILGLRGFTDHSIAHLHLDQLLD